jgi:hypothetical protein
MAVERERHEREAVERAARARSNEAENWRRRTTLVIPPDDDREVFYPQGRLERPFIEVYAPSRAPVRAFERADPTNYYARSAEVVRLRAVQMAHMLANGRTVMWWTWEVGR